MKNFRVFKYAYSNASNYKSWGSLLLRDVVTEGDAELLIKKISSACYVVAEQLDVPQF